MTQHIAKLEKAIAAVRVAAQEIVKLNESPSTRWISVSVDDRGAELPGIYITASTSPTPKPRKIDEERIVIYELWKFFPDATEKDYQSDHWTISVEDFPDDWEGGLSELFSVEFQGGETPIRMYNGFEELVEKLAKTPMRESSGLVKASAEPRAILQAISGQQGWTLTHTVKETAERIGVSRRAIWDWLNGSAVPIAQNKLALYYCQFEPGTEIEIRGEDPEARMHARAVFQAGLKPKSAASYNVED